MCVRVCGFQGKVVLAESQPLTDMQIQQTLLREMAGLSCTAADADNEPCSPTRLLYNIERQVAHTRARTHSHSISAGTGAAPPAVACGVCDPLLPQSAQLSQFVNSLMPPLGFSPAKPRQSCKRQKVFPR